MNLCWLVAHPSRAAAVRAETDLHAMQAAVYPTAGRNLRPVRCRRCLQWHVQCPPTKESR